MLARINTCVLAQSYCVGFAKNYFMFHSAKYYVISSSMVSCRAEFENANVNFNRY